VTPADANAVISGEAVGRLDPPSAAPAPAGAPEASGERDRSWPARVWPARPGPGEPGDVDGEDSGDALTTLASGWDQRVRTARWGVGRHRG
jgi:hypothetical protein